MVAFALRVPLVIGLGGLFLVTYTNSPGFDELTSLFVIVTLVGVVTVGPWVCLQTGRLRARARSATVLAARRIEHDPKASFRAASGLVALVIAATPLAVLTALRGTAQFAESDPEG